MSTKVKNSLIVISLAFIGVVIALALLGFIFFPRADLPTRASEDICEQYKIHFDTTSIEKIYHNPESILADPQAFLQEDPAYSLLNNSRERGADPFRYEIWLASIKKLASQPLNKRKQQVSYKLYERIMTNQGAFCREIGPHVLSFLPQASDLGEVTIYLTALDQPVPAYADNNKVAFSLSHPLFKYSSMIHEPTGLSTFFNLALQEVHHIGFAETYPWPSVEELIQNEIVIDMLLSLHRESIGTYIEYELLEQYPSPFEYFLYLIDKEMIVNSYIKAMNDLFAIAAAKPEGEAYNETYKQIGALCYRRKGFYIVGGYMALTIDRELGREALVQTMSDGYESFVETYNAVAKDSMRIQWK